MRSTAFRLEMVIGFGRTWENIAESSISSVSIAVVAIKIGRASDRSRYFSLIILAQWSPLMSGSWMSISTWVNDWLWEKDSEIVLTARIPLLTKVTSRISSFSKNFLRI